MTATILEAVAEDVVNMGDLDLLDGQRHRACAYCYPEYLPFGARFIAKCGREAIASGLVQVTDPPNACPQCRVLPYGDCPRCGA